MKLFVKPTKSPTIGGVLLGAGVGLGFALFFGWDLLRHFRSTDLGEPFRQHATHFNQLALNFAAFSAFVLKVAFDATFFCLGIFLVIRVAYVTIKYRVRPSSR
jgi:hypothetical protein